MTTIDTEVDLVRIRLNHIERRVMRIEARLSGLPLSEPIPFPVTPRTTPLPQSQHYCNFCGKAQEEVASLIAGPGPIFICSECVALCHEIEQKREIIRRVRAWAGDDAQAWYQAESIPAFGGRTAEALVKEGKAHAVRDYLDAVANGSFA